MPEAFIPYTVTGSSNAASWCARRATRSLMLNTVRREIWAVDRNVAHHLHRTR